MPAPADGAAPKGDAEPPAASQRPDTEPSGCAALPPRGPGWPSWATAAVAGFETWLAIELGRSPHTVRAYLRDIYALLEHALARGATGTSDLDTPTVRSWLAEGHAHGWSRATIARRTSSARAFTDWASRSGRSPGAPGLRLATPSRARHLPRVLTAAEAAALCATAEAAASSGPPGRRDHALVELLYGTGLRVGEAVGADVDALDEERRTMRVLGKGGAERVLPLGGPAWRALQSWLRIGRPELATPRSGAALFLGARGGRLDQRQARQAIARLGRVAGLGDVHPHALRHSAATHMLDGGSDLRCVQELLGHATLTSTEIYTHVSQARLVAAYRRAHPRA